MKATTYRHPTSWGIRFLVGGAAVVVGLTFFAAMAIGIAVPEGWMVTHIAREIAVTDLDIVGKPFLGRTVHLRWNELQAADHFLVFSLDSPFPTVYRLIARDRRTIAFTSKIEGCDELMNEIRSRTTALDHLAEARWWQKLILRGWP
jgi:hypothetical protein